MGSSESLECSLSPELQAKCSQGKGREQWGFGGGGFWDQGGRARRGGLGMPGKVLRVWWLRRNHRADRE